jgi:hypothetical protein
MIHDELACILRRDPNLDEKLKTMTFSEIMDTNSEARAYVENSSEK